MAQTLKLKRSAVSGKAPALGDLQLGELGLNTFDGKLYTRKDNGTASIVELSGGSVSGGASNLADGTAATPAVNFSSDTDTGVFRAGADRLAFATNGASVGEFNGSNLQFDSGYGSVATAYGCRAWVNFNGTSQGTIRASGNVSSVTYNAIGDYTVNFTTAMPDINYALLATSQAEPDTSSRNDSIGYSFTNFTYSTTATRLRNQRSTGSAMNSEVVSVAVFR